MRGEGGDHVGCRSDKAKKKMIKISDSTDKEFKAGIFKEVIEEGAFEGGGGINLSLLH